MLIESNLLLAALANEGLLRAVIKLGDADYNTPRADWLLGEFEGWFRDALRRLGIEAYVDEAGDCDDYADLYAVLARVCHRRMPKCAGTALPVGVLHYRTSAGNGHAINVALTSDRGLLYIEPQTGKTVTLTAEEKRSAWLLKF